MTASRTFRAAGPALALLAVLGGLLYWQQSQRPGPAVTPLSGDAAGNSELLRAAFNRDAGKVRLLLLLDPT